MLCGRKLHKYDHDTLRNQDAFAFEEWILGQFGGRSNSKQRNDFGIDGTKEIKSGVRVPVQVKRSDSIGRNVVDNFFSALRRFDKRTFEKQKEAGEVVGYIIAFSFNRGAVREVARLKNTEGVVIELVTVSDIVPIAQKPHLEVNLADTTPLADDLPQENKDTLWEGMREISFTAKARSDSGIEFYSWDFSYDGKTFLPDILLDKKGMQKRKFEAGTHHIAVKVVDNEGLESIESLKLKINGGVKKI